VCVEGGKGIKSENGGRNEERYEEVEGRKKQS